jgi:hypothetical protein
VKVLHLVRPESGRWEEQVAAHQSAAGDQVIVARWRDSTDTQIACDVVSELHGWRTAAETVLTYDDLLDVLFQADRVYCW